MPVVIERLKIRQRDSAIKSEHSLINLEDIFTKPVALEVLTWTVMRKRLEYLFPSVEK